MHNSFTQNSRTLFLIKQVFGASRANALKRLSIFGSFGKVETKDHLVRSQVLYLELTRTKQNREDTQFLIKTGFLEAASYPGVEHRHSDAIPITPIHAPDPKFGIGTSLPL